jgi:hypothetical protein
LKSEPQNIEVKRSRLVESRFCGSLQELQVEEIRPSHLAEKSPAETVEKIKDQYGAERSGDQRSPEPIPFLVRHSYPDGDDAQEQDGSRNQSAANYEKTASETFHGGTGNYVMI